MLKLLHLHTGKHHSLDYDQQIQLDIIPFKTVKGELWFVESVFKEGFMNQSLTDVGDDLQIANTFYRVLDSNTKNHP